VIRFKDSIWVAQNATCKNIQDKKLDLQNFPLSRSSRDVLLIGKHCKTILLSATIFSTPTGAVRVKCNYPHQFAWHLHSTEEILAWIITAWFIHQMAKKLFTDQKKLCVAMFHCYVHTAYTVCIMDKCYFRWWY
jgi:hypothetical protein